MVPSALASIVSAMCAPALAKRMPMGVVIGAGLAVSTVGYVFIALVDPVGGLPLLVAGFVVAFFGTGPIGALGTNLVVGSAPPEKGGSAASLSETSGEFGVSLGVAAFGSLGTAVYRNELSLPAGTPEKAAEASRNGAEGAVSVAEELSGRVGSQLLTAARDAYTSGLNTIGVVCAVLIAVTACIAVTTLRRVGAGGSDDPGDSGQSESTEDGTSADKSPGTTEGSLSSST
jgi:DHA2 family multidrug resistance protein-like MFS transporter